MHMYVYTYIMLIPSKCLSNPCGWSSVVSEAKQERVETFDKALLIPCSDKCAHGIRGDRLVCAVI